MRPPEGIRIEVRRIEAIGRLHPRVVARVTAERAALERMLTPEALARLDGAERDFERRVLGV